MADSSLNTAPKALEIFNIGELLELILVFSFESLEVCRMETIAHMFIITNFNNRLRRMDRRSALEEKWALKKNLFHAYDLARVSKVWLRVFQGSRKLQEFCYKQAVFRNVDPADEPIMLTVENTVLNPLLGHSHAGPFKTLFKPEIARWVVQFITMDDSGAVWERENGFDINIGESL
jgi:hypothetical protein